MTVSILFKLSRIVFVTLKLLRIDLWFCLRGVVLFNMDQIIITGHQSTAYFTTGKLSWSWSSSMLLLT